MVSLTLPIEEKTLKRIQRFSWVNWSEIARQEILKKEIFEKYMKTGKITKQDWKFCEREDWHPVDQLPLREEYVKKLKKQLKQPSKRMTREEFDQLV